MLLHIVCTVIICSIITHDDFSLKVALGRKRRQRTHQKKKK